MSFLRVTFITKCILYLKKALGVLSPILYFFLFRETLSGKADLK